MKIARYTRLLGALCLLLPGAGNAAADWSTSGNPYATLAAPVDGATVRQNPPDFRWPFIEGAVRHEVQVQCGTSQANVFTTRRNWLVLSAPLPVGDCRWSVRYLTQEGSPSAWSTVRRFQILTTATAVALPKPGDVVPRIARLPHPRSLPQGREGALWRSAVREQRAAALAQILAEKASPLPAEPNVIGEAFSADRKEQTRGYNLTRELGPHLQRLQRKALTSRITSDENCTLDALDLARQLAQWNPRGASGAKSNDQINREFAWSLALAYDLLYDRLTPEERQTIAISVATRTTDMYGAYLGSQRVIERMPYDSHGWVTMAKVTAIASLMAGSLPQFNPWLEDSLPWYWQSISPWGGEDGGFANGTAYAVWDVEASLPVWTILSRVTGIDWYRKPWIAATGNYFAAFLPPGAPSGMFGDEAESRYGGVWATLAKAYAASAPTSLNRWYARQQFGENLTQIGLLLAPLPPDDVSSNLPEGIPDSLYLPSIGWAAMHSRLADRARTSIYFKASPYGSFNHSHADQNSFVLYDRGEPLLIDSGIYDWYGSPHWKQWYTQTRAHNAITFDGGQGQVPFKRESVGRITTFSDNGQIALVTGDATTAYGGALDRAVRSLIYLRPNVLLVIDTLASRQPRRWEWNLHALQRIEETSPGRLRIAHGGTSLCASLLQSPLVEFQQNSHFPIPPDTAVRKTHSGSLTQWHGAWISQSPSREARFVTLIDIGCQGDEGIVSMNGNHIALASTGFHLTLARDGSVTLEGTSVPRKPVDQ